MSKHSTIETLQMPVDIPDVVQSKVNQTFDKIIENAVEEEKVTRKVSRFSKKKVAIIIAAATICLASVSVAAAYLNWSKSLSEGLRATEAQKVQLEQEKMSTFVNQSCTDQGITVTAVQSITDKYYTHLAFKVEGFKVEEGVQPDFESVKVTIDGKDDFSSGGGFYDGLVQGPDGYPVHADGTPIDWESEDGYIDNYVLDDGTMEYQMTLANSHEEGYFINKSIHVEINNIGTVAKAEYTNEINATWTFDWELEGSENTKECTLNVPLGDTGATVVKAELSPISLRAEYQFARQEVTQTSYDESGPVEFTSFAEPPNLMGVKMKDGTLYPSLYLGPGSMGYESEDSDIYMTAFAIDRIIDVEQVESLLFVKSYPEGEERMTEDNFYIVPIE